MDDKENIIDQRLILLRRRWRDSPWSDPDQSFPKRQEPQRLLTVAISREAGAPGSEIGQELGKRLDWPVYDREILDLIAERAVLRTELVESIDEQDSNWFTEAIRSFALPRELGRAGYLYHLTKVLAALAAHGRCVIVGRGATALLPSDSTLRLRVIGPLKQRIGRMAEQRGVSTSEAEEIVLRVDHERREFVSHHFHKDVNDPHGFDLVLNSDRYTPAELAEMAWVAVRLRQQGFAVKEMARD
jgi:hypothetical protein